MTALKHIYSRRSACAARLFPAPKRGLCGNNPFEKVEEIQNLSGLEKIKFVLKYSLQRSDTVQLSQVAASVLRSPIYIGKQVSDSINTMAVYFTQYMEEGVKDGSLQVGNPQQTAETLLLLINVWFSPLIFPCTKEDYRKRYEQLKLMYASVGLPIFDDELQSLSENLYDVITKTEK